MRVIGECSDDEASRILEDQYDLNDGEYILDRLDGACFESFLNRAYPKGPKEEK